MFGRKPRGNTSQTNSRESTILVCFTIRQPSQVSLFILIPLPINRPRDLPLNSALQVLPLGATSDIWPVKAAPKVLQHLNLPDDGDKNN